jgi:hypothetical protein
VTAGGTVDTGLGRGFLVGDGDMLAEVVLGGYKPVSAAAALSLPLAARMISSNGRSSCLSIAVLPFSLAPLALPPVGCGERALDPNVFFGFALAICSK